MIEKYFLYSPSGELAGICSAQGEAMAAAREAAKGYGSCEVEQVCITETGSSQKRIRCYPDGRFEKLWQETEGAS